MSGRKKALSTFTAKFSLETPRITFSDSPESGLSRQVKCSPIVLQAKIAGKLYEVPIKVSSVSLEKNEPSKQQGSVG